METIRKFFSGVAVLLAKGYNSLHPKLKIGIMVATSFIISGWINLVIRDLADYGTVNDYAKTFIDGLIPLLTVVVNLVQQWGVEAGTQILASNGDKKTIEKLESTVEEKQKLINQGK